MITCAAYAKINLTLEVVGRRPDGYHEVVSVIQAVDLHDVVRVAPDDDLTLACNDPSLAGEGNLAFRAASLLRERTGTRQGAAIALDKRIPSAAGLGGGSSDAAAALLALDRLWGLALPEGELEELAAGLGSDVPYCLRGGTALVAGRGERVERLPAAPPRWFVLLRPSVVLAGKTATLYRQLTPADFDDGAATHAAARALRHGRFPPERLLVNTFEKVAAGVFPGLASARERLRAAAGGRAVHLCGAGPTLFALFTARAPAARALHVLRSAGTEAYLVRGGPWRPTPTVTNQAVPSPARRQSRSTL